MSSFVDPALHLVRHGEVYNPDHVVYATLTGFGLSDLGWRQAEATADRLARLDVASVLSSPLQRAVETAATIAAPHRKPVATDPRLEEWSLGTRWAGLAWETLPQQFPGELEAYLAHPHDLPFTEETLDQLADRMAASIHDMWECRDRPAHAIVVSHQDPIEAVRRLMTGRDFAEFHTGKPGHATVITLVPDGAGWREAEVWTPAQS